MYLCPETPLTIGQAFNTSTNYRNNEAYKMLGRLQRDENLFYYEHRDPDITSNDWINKGDRIRQAIQMITVEELSGVG